MKHIIFLAAAVCLLAPSARGWSTKEHILLTRLAAERLMADPSTSPAMRDWLRRGLRGERTLNDEKEFLLHARIGAEPRGTDGLAFWAVMPDLQAALSGSGEREIRVQPFRVSERLLHYVDVEYFYSDPSKRDFADDLSHKPRLEDFPRDMHDERWARAGMLPFRVEQCYRDLVGQIRAGRLNDQPGQYPRDEHAEKWAGLLAHYVEDNTQPQHATVDFRSSHYFKDKINAPNVHSDMEYRLVDDDRDDYPLLREEFWSELVKDLELVKDPVGTQDPWQSTLATLLDSYDALPVIGRAAAAAYGKDSGTNSGGYQRMRFDAAVFYHFEGQFRGRSMNVLQIKAWQNALAVVRLEEFWRQAWRDAQVPTAR